MNLKTQRRLNEINRSFYRVTAVEFSATRQSAWQGWRRMLHSVELPVSSVLDIGCGNGRFGRFLAEGQEQAFVYYGIDSSSELLAAARRQLADLPHLQLELVEQDIVVDQLPTLQAQLVVLFGLCFIMCPARNKGRACCALRRNLSCPAVRLSLRPGASSNRNASANGLCPGPPILKWKNMTTCWIGGGASAPCATVTT